MSKSYKNVSSVIPHAIKHTSNISFSNFLNCTWCDVDVPLPNATTSKSDTNSWIEKQILLLHMGHQNKWKRKDLPCNHFTSAEAHNQNKSPNLHIKEYYYKQTVNHLSVKSFIITGTFRGPPMTWEITYMNQS